MEVSDTMHALCDDSLAEILVRLDAVSVLRCRAVCKSWRRIATDHSFLATHAARRPREMIVGTEYYGSTRRFTVPLSLDPDDVATTTTDHHNYLFDPSPRAADGDGLYLCASLDGLLLLEQRRRRQSPYHNARNNKQQPAIPAYIVCNPVTRQWTNLPALCSAAAVDRFEADVCGFYFHASSGEYRVLFHCEVVGMESYFCIVSVGGGTVPRRPARGGPAFGDVHVPCYEMPAVGAVRCHGSLHWLLLLPGDARGERDIMAFDTVSETFRRLRPRPPPGLEQVGRPADLLELEGELSVAIMQDRYVRLDIWALQDYDDGADGGWTLRHRVHLQPPHLFLRKSHRLLQFKAFSVGSSAILIGFGDDEGRVYSLKEDGVYREIDFGGFPKFRLFSESLVPHAFFDLPRCPEILPLNFDTTTC